MKKRLVDMFVGQVVMAVVMLLIGLAYEGVGYSNISDIMPYIIIGIIQLVIAVPVAAIGLAGVETLKHEFKDLKTERRKLNKA